VKYLVDANVLSEPTKPSPDPRVVDWLHAHEPDMAVNPVILGELRFGLLSFQRERSGPRWNSGSMLGPGVSTVFPGIRTLA
jgi:predicted nucleic acid-binding protein